MKLHYLLIGILVISMISLGMMEYLTELGDNYNSVADVSGLSNTTARLNETRQRANDVKEQIDNFKLENLGDYFAIPYRMIKTGWAGMRLMFNSWGTLGTMVEETGGEISDTIPGIPNWLVPTIISMIVATLVTIVVYAFLKWKAET